MTIDGALEGVEVELTDLHHHFGDVRALDGLSLTLQPGELVSLLGPSGCGKTTALRLLAGLDVATSGRITIGGSDITGVATNKRGMGMVFQAYSLFPHLTVLDNVAFGLKLRKVGAAQRRKRAGEMLELVGLAQHASRYPRQLSGGQQQRVALARALAIQPRVLLLDEPLSALDAKVREQLREEIRRIQRELGVTTFMVTHDQEEALSMSDRVGVMRAGRLEQIATPPELYEHPATPFVGEFIGTMNRLPATAEPEGRVRILGQSVPAHGEERHAGSHVTVLVRPEALLVEAADDGPWTVASSTFRGATSRLVLRQAGQSDLLADVGAHRAGDLAPGTHVRVSLLERPVLIEG